MCCGSKRYAKKIKKRQALFRSFGEYGRRMQCDVMILKKEQSRWATFFSSSSSGLYGLEDWQTRHSDITIIIRVP